MNRSHPIVFRHASRNPLVLAATTLAVVAAVLLPIASAHAVTYTVCASACDYTTVQAAIDAASDGDTLSLMDPVQNESNIQVDKNVTIQGQGAASTSVDGGGSGAVFTVAGSATFQDLTITGGAAYSGAAVSTTTTDNGIVQIINCSISGNVASAYGGGISNNSTRATIEVSDSTISNNIAVSDDAGGIFSYGPLTVSGSTITDNIAGNAGGGVVTFPSGILTIVNSTISNNMAGGYSSEGNPTPYVGTGGGVFSYAAIEVTNSTFSGNSVVDGTLANVNSHGGAITSVGTAGGSLAISSSTVSDNSAGYGGGIYTANETFDEKDTIIGGNTGGDCFSSFSTINAEHSLDTDDTCGAGSATVTSAALDLGPLVVNAPGTTATQALLQDSVAIDATIDCTDLSGNTITADQRGVARPQGLACDIGAYEYQPGVAQTHTVCADPRCESTTVQGAINNSNDGDTVEIDASLPVVIEQGIDVPRDVTIQGQGPSNTRIQGNGTDSVFHLEQSATIEDLTVSGGATTLSGGGIDSSGGPTATVQVRNVDVTGNSAAGDGGGISASGGATVVVTNTNVSGNTARNHGGGISGEGPVVLTNSTVSNNQVVAPGGLMAQDSSSAGGFMLDDDPTSTMGGGVYADGALTLTDTTISGNSADIGGGIMDNAPYTESSSITGSTISGNTATESGGGIDTLGVLTIDNSTISDNSTAGDGGGIFFRNTALGSLAISNSTMAGNSAAASGGGGIYANGSFDVKSTIIGNSASGGDCAYYYPMPNAVGNLDTDGSCGSGFATVTPTELSLAPLTVNAPGTTATQALFSNSLAIDTAVDCTDFDGIAVVTDQRGVSRPQGPSCDIGAYEYVHVDYIEPLGHGYWKNHLDAVAPLLPVSIDDQYSVNTTDQATAVFRSMNCKDATNCLAGELLTAVLNVENGSDPCIDPTVDSAQDLLSLLGYLGPGGSVPQTKAQRQEALALHSLLGDYNSDMGCPQ